MREIKRKSAVPVYGAAAAVALYCLLFPLYKLSHFFLMIAAAALTYFLLSLLFPGKVEIIEEAPEPETTGNPEADALAAEGRRAAGEMRRLKAGIADPAVSERIERIAVLTERIFRDAADDPADIPQIRRFADYFLPTTLKLLHTYDRMGEQGVAGDNIRSTMERIENVLDATEKAYQKQLDALFANENLDIDTDITVLEGMLKREGLSGSDF